MSYQVEFLFVLKLLFSTEIICLKKNKLIYNKSINFFLLKNTFSQEQENIFQQFKKLQKKIKLEAAKFDSCN